MTRKVFSCAHDCHIAIYGRAHPIIQKENKVLCFAIQINYTYTCFKTNVRYRSLWHASIEHIISP